jgi:8-oxo-dGTP diphosphatase
MAIGRFTCGIAAIIWYPTDNTYLLLKRSSDKDAGANEWECVTGRVDQGESFEEALHREVWEEVQAKITLEMVIGTSHFFRGAAITENEMLSVHYLCSIDDPTQINISHEHSEYRWLTLDQLVDLLSPTHWLAREIEHTQAAYHLMSPELRRVYRARFQ